MGWELNGLQLLWSLMRGVHSGKLIGLRDGDGNKILKWMGNEELIPLILLKLLNV